MSINNNPYDFLNTSALDAMRKLQETSALTAVRELQASSAVTAALKMETTGAFAAVRELQSTLNAVKSSMGGATAALEEYRKIVAPISESIKAMNLAYAPIFEQTRSFDTLNIKGIISGLQTSTSAISAISGLNLSGIASIIDALPKYNFLSDMVTDDFSVDVAEKLYESGEITQDDINEEITEIVSKKQFSPKAEWDKIKKSKWFIAIKILIIIATFVCKPVTEYATDKALDKLGINEFWEESGVYDLIDSIFGDTEESIVSEAEAKATVDESKTGNISKQKREDLLNKIKEIRTFISSAPQDENTGNLLSYLSELEKDVCGKKYGLVFEEHREEIDEVLSTHTPVLTEDTDLFIDNGGQMNFLIEGDNLASLQLLEKTHKGKIDLIYIDPPYNTGNQDFIYDDKFIVSEDGFKHSKYISFLKKRLEIMCKLLSPQGFICISIDDNEQPDIRFLCDEVFGAENFISCMSRRTKSSGKTTNHISANHDYVIIYAKNIASVGIVGIPHIDEGFKFEDEYVETRGKYKLNQTLDYDSLSYSAGLDYPIELNGKIFYPGSDYNKYLKRKNGEHQRADWAWRWSKELFEFGYNNGFIVVKEKADGTARIYTKTYLNATIKRNTSGKYEVIISERKKPLSTLDFLDAEYSNDNAKKDLKQIFTNFAFDYPKPLSLLKKIMQICYSDSAIVLDCFAGSGTTGHAVMKLNAEDGGNRKFILCTNNENNICRDVTYERIKRVIDKDGYTASLKYYKVDYIPISDRMYYEYADKLLKHIRELVELENGVNFTNNAEIGIVLTEEELDEFVANIEDFSKCKKLYMGHDLLPSDEQERALKKGGIEISIIPDYYYRDLQEG